MVFAEEVVLIVDLIFEPRDVTLLVHDPCGCLDPDHHNALLRIGDFRLVAPLECIFLPKVTQ